MKQENLQNVRIAYMRSVGEYESKNHELMETFKAFLSENDLFGEDAVILGIALDNPTLIPAEEATNANKRFFKNNLYLCILKITA
jgi:DNA gyrase inhibitor GyrI